MNTSYALLLEILELILRFLKTWLALILPGALD